MKWWLNDSESALKLESSVETLRFHEASADNSYFISLLSWGRREVSLVGWLAGGSPSTRSFLGDLVVRNPSASAGDVGLTPGSGQSSGEGNGCSFQYSCLENSMDRSTWGATVHRVAKSWPYLGDWACTYPAPIYFYCLYLVLYPL